MTSWPAACGRRWVKPSKATVSPSRTSPATASRKLTRRAGAVTGTPPLGDGRTRSPGVPDRELRVDVDPDALGLGVLPHGLEAHLSAVPGQARPPNGEPGLTRL